MPCPTSDTVWLPVVDLLEARVAVGVAGAAVRRTVVESILRSKRPGSVFGHQVLDDLDLGLALVGDRAHDVGAVGDVHGHRPGAGARGHDRAGAVAGLALDARRVVGQGRLAVGRLGHGVVTGVERLLAGVPLWAASSFWTVLSILRSKRPASVVGLTFLTTSSLPGLAGVRDRAHDVRAVRDVHGHRPCAGARGHDRAGAVGALALDGARVVSQRRLSVCGLGHGVVTRVERLLAGRVVVGGLVLLDGVVDPQVEAAGVGRRVDLLHDLELAGLAGVRDRAHDV